MDALTRRKRMQGYEALWLPGMDHAGIATQNVVERSSPRRASPGTTWAARRSSSGSGGGRRSTAAGSSARCGGSATASTGRRERFTMDEGLSRAVQTIFKKLYDDGLIYRAERIINWCPRCLTAISDIEVEYQDDDGELVSITLRRGRRDRRRRHHPRRDDARRHRGGRPPRRRALPAPGRQADQAAAHRPDHPGRRGRARRPGVRHRRGQGHPGPRPERLRDRPAARPGVDRRSWTSAGSSPCTAPSRAWTGSRRARRSSSALRARAGSSPRSGRTSTRSATARAAGPRSSRGCRSSGGSRSRPLAKAAGDAVRDGRVTIHPAGDVPAVLRLGRQHARLVHLAPAVVGPPHPGLVRPGRRDGLRRPGRAAAVRRGLDARTPTCWTPGSPPRLWPFSTLGWPDRTEDLAKFYPNSAWSPATTSCSSGSPG